MLSSLPLGRSGVTMRRRSDSAEALCGPQAVPRERPAARPLGLKAPPVPHRLVLALARSDSAADNGGAAAAAGSDGSAPLSPPRCAFSPHVCLPCSRRVLWTPSTNMLGMQHRLPCSFWRPTLPARSCWRLPYIASARLPYLAADPAPFALWPLCPRSAGARGWGEMTDWLVGASTLPFIFLFLPQLLKNAANLSAGNSAALAVLSWLVRLGQGQCYARGVDVCCRLTVQPRHFDNLAGVNCRI